MLIGEKLLKLNKKTRKIIGSLINEKLSKHDKETRK